MIFIKNGLDASEKLNILSRDSQYDLACACAMGEDEHRRCSRDDKWIYPVTMADGRITYLFKTLLSNVCVNTCKYCPLRTGTDVQRCSLSPEELARTFLSYYRARRVCVVIDSYTLDGGSLLGQESSPSPCGRG